MIFLEMGILFTLGSTLALLRVSDKLYKLDSDREPKWFHNLLGNSSVALSVLLVLWCLQWLL